MPAFDPVFSPQWFGFRPIRLAGLPVRCTQTGGARLFGHRTGKILVS